MLCCHNPQHTSHQIISSIVRSSVCVLKSPLNCIQIASLRGAGYTIALNLRNSLSRLYEHISKCKFVLGLRREFSFLFFFRFVRGSQLLIFTFDSSVTSKSNVHKLCIPFAIHLVVYTLLRFRLDLYLKFEESLLAIKIATCTVF